MKLLGLIGIILLGIVHPGKTYDPGTLCLYQTSTFYERFGLEYSYRIINRRVAAKVYLIHNTSSMWVDKEIVKHQNDVMMLIVGRTSKMFHLHEQLQIKHPITDFELTGSQINDGNEPFLEWASKYVPSYDVGNETTLPPFMLFEDSTNEENFADQFMLAKYPYDPVNYTSSNESLPGLANEESESMIQKWAKREYRSEKKMEKGKRITMFVRDMAENDDEIDEEEDSRQREKYYDKRREQQEEEEGENNDLKPVRAKKPRRGKGYRMQCTRKSRNGMLYARMMRGYDRFRQPYGVESWPRPVYRASRAKRVRNQNVQRYSYFNPSNDAQFRRVVKPFEQNNVRQMNVAPKMHVFSHGANEIINQHMAQMSAVVKTRKVKAANKVKNSTKAKIPRARKTVKSAAKVAAKPAIKTALKFVAKAGMKSVAKRVAKSAVKTVAKSAVKTAAKSAVKTAEKSAVKVAGRSAVRKSVVRAVPKSAGKSAARNAAKASAKDTVKPKVTRGRKQNPTTSTLLGYITYMEPGPFIPYINNKVGHNGPQMAARPHMVAKSQMVAHMG